MSIHKTYVAMCDNCDIHEDTFKNKKHAAEKQLRDWGWIIGKKVLCPDCVARKTKKCRRCGSKLFKNKQILECRRIGCYYWIE